MLGRPCSSLKAPRLKSGVHCLQITSSDGLLLVLWRQVGTASLTGMMLEDSGGSDGADPLEWVQRQEVDELKVRAGVAAFAKPHCRLRLPG